MRATTVVLFALLSSVAHAAESQHEFDWVTIGDPANRAATEDEAAYNNMGRGSVGYEYRLGRTEVTVSQHLAFLQAIEPYVPSWDTGPSSRRQWLGDRIGVRPDNGDLFAAVGWENTATTMSFYTAARFCNWLHNGQVNEAWAFESGAYDVSTFGTFNDDGTPADQLVRSEGAEFWIPNLDEWIKGMYWDPTKDGVGGYWMYPHASDVPPVSGLPGEPGAQTSAGPLDENGPKAYYPIDVGSYPDAASFWGLLDGSGGASEYAESDAFTSRVRRSGSDRTYDDFFSGLDDIRGAGISARPDSFLYGVRLATSVPSPGMATLPILSSWLLTRRKRHQSHTVSTLRDGS